MYVNNIKRFSTPHPRYYTKPATKPATKLPTKLSTKLGENFFVLF